MTIELRKPNGQLKDASEFSQADIEALEPTRIQALQKFQAAQKDFAGATQAMRDATDAIVTAEKTRNEFAKAFSKKFVRTFRQEWEANRSHPNLPRN